MISSSAALFSNIEWFCVKLQRSASSSGRIKSSGVLIAEFSRLFRVPCRSASKLISLYYQAVPYSCRRIYLHNEYGFNLYNGDDFNLYNEDDFNLYNEDDFDLYNEDDFNLYNEDDFNLYNEDDFNLYNEDDYLLEY